MNLLTLISVKELDVNFINAFFRIVIGVVFGAASAMALSPALAAFATGDQDSTVYVAFGVIGVSVLLGFFAPSIRRAFGRGFLLLGASVFALPVSTFLLSGRVASDMVESAAANDEAATAIGAGIAGMAMTGVATFFGVIVGSILLIIGLILSLGGRREVVVVNASAETAK